jgi:pimeloyl-ACP methyl ester carboxylesterase
VSATSADGAALAAAWEAAGDRVTVDGHRLWFRRVTAASDAGHPPLLVLHGFPTSSIDWLPVLDDLAAERDVVFVDCLGFGLSDKPDLRYGIRRWADGVEGVVAHLGIDRVDLLTHDMGDTVGGELLARDLDGALAFSIGRRVLTNGSIYIDMAQLTDGQQLLLSLPDQVEPLVGADEGVAFRRGVHATFSPGTPEEDQVLDAATLLAVRDGGLSMMPRTIRYIEDRRAEESRFTGAIEAHPSPLGVVWGEDDPVAVHDMARRITERVARTPLVTLDGVGHYPMVEAPDRFVAAVLDLLAR